MDAREDCTVRTHVPDMHIFVEVSPRADQDDGTPVVVDDDVTGMVSKDPAVALEEQVCHLGDVAGIIGGDGEIALVRGLEWPRSCARRGGQKAPVNHVI